MVLILLLSTRIVFSMCDKNYWTSSKHLHQASKKKLQWSYLFWLTQYNNNTRKNGVICNWMTAVYAKAAAMHYSDVYHRPKSRSRSAKRTKTGGCLISAILPNMNILGEVLGTLEQENWKVGQGVLTFFAKVKVTHAIYPLRPFRAVWLCTVTSL